MNAIQFWTQTGALVLAIIGAIVYQTHYIDKRIEGLRDLLISKIDGVEKRLDAKIDSLLVLITVRIEGTQTSTSTKIDSLKQELQGIQKRLDRIEDRLEIPTVHKP